VATKKNEILNTVIGDAPYRDDSSTSDQIVATTKNPQLDPELLKKVAQVRSHVRESFGKVVMAMMVLPRYRAQSLADLQHLVLEPLIRDRVAIAYPGSDADPLADIAGLAIWASVSDEAEGRIREQIASGVFPLRLKPEDWTSGPNNWLLDVIAPNARATANVIANFKQVVKDGSLKLHPIVAKLVDPETLQKMGATRLGGPDKPAPEGSMPEPVGTA
jgi:cytolysin-activating lysine-acyltransferase